MFAYSVGILVLYDTFKEHLVLGSCQPAQTLSPMTGAAFTLSLSAQGGLRLRLSHEDTPT